MLCVYKDQDRYLHMCIMRIARYIVTCLLYIDQWNFTLSHCVRVPLVFFLHITIRTKPTQCLQYMTLSSSTPQMSRRIIAEVSVSNHSVRFQELRNGGQILLIEFNVVCRKILDSTFNGPVSGITRSKAKPVTELCTQIAYEDPGRGMTCGPKAETQAIQNCAGVMPFFCDNFAICSAKTWFAFIA